MNQLTGFRLVLSFYLLLFHTLPAFYRLNYAGNLLNYGNICTSLFIVLSGFGLTAAYYNKDVNYRVFTLKRFLKFYPLLLLLLLLAVSITFDILLRHKFSVALNEGFAPGSVIYVTYIEYLVAAMTSVFMLDAWNPFFFGLNAPSWTLSCLFFCYFLFPLLIKWVRKINKYEFLYLCGLLLASSVFPLIMLSLGYNESSSHDEKEIYTLHNFFYGFLHRNPLVRLPEFMMGMVLFLVYKKYRNFPVHFATILLLVVTALSFSIQLIFPVPFALRHHLYFLPFELVLIIWLLNNDNKITKLLADPTMVRFGKMTFTLYLVHMPVQALFVRFDKAVYRYSNFGKEFLFKSVEKINDNYQMSLSSYIVYLVLVLLVTYLLHNYFAFNWYNKYFGDRKKECDKQPVWRTVKNYFSENFFSKV